MSIDLGNQSVTLNMKDRLCGVDIYLDDNDVVQLRFRREKAFYSGGVLQHRTSINSTTRTQADVASKPYTAAGATRTGNQILALINQMSDVERQVDIDNGG